jgi:hypothetical protein
MLDKKSEGGNTSGDGGGIEGVSSDDSPMGDPSETLPF